jgi:hypothetical protein
MRSPNSELPWHELGKLHHGLATADESQIAKVVALVDALEARGAADDVIAPLRPRLAQLRPRRPLRFCRLLFIPLDPLIVPAAAWRPGNPTIPRTVLLSLAETVHATMGSGAQAIDGAIQNHGSENSEIARSAGRLLWPAAANILAATPPPIGWAKSGLPTDTYAPIARQLAVLLEQTAPLHTLFAEVDVGVSLRVEPLLPILEAAARHSAGTLAMMVTLVLARLPEARDLLGAAVPALGPQGEALMRVATERAIEVLLNRLETPNGIETLVVGSSLADAGPEVRRIARLLEGMEATGDRTGWRPRVRSITQRFDASCRLRFATALEGEFVEPLRALKASAGSNDVARLEDSARGLQGLQQEARRIGSPEIYDMLLQQTAALAKTIGSDEALGLVGRVRLVEILAGPDEAAAMLDAAA